MKGMNTTTFDIEKRVNEYLLAMGHSQRAIDAIPIYRDLARSNILAMIDEIGESDEAWNKALIQIRLNVERMDNEGL